MPFGSMPASRKQPSRQKKDPEPKPAQDAPKPVPSPPKQSVLQLNVALFGRNQEIILEFLCSLKQNAGEVIQSSGISFYTESAQTLNLLTERKKRIETFFWEFCQEDWVFSPDTEASKRVYSFRLSPSGKQTRVLDVFFHCFSLEQSEKSWAGMDAAWILTDGVLTDPKAAASDAYLRSVNGLLQANEFSESVPVCLILSQIETLGHIDQRDGIDVFPPADARKLLSCCRSVFSLESQKAKQLVMFPVQTYGGLDCVGTDPHGAPRLHINTSGYYQSYRPMNCELPLIYTLDKIGAIRNTGFFDNPDGSSLHDVMRRYFAQRSGALSWMPLEPPGEEDAK